MEFESFARLHGLLLRDLYPSERIRRCPTEDKPRSTNGAYYYNGERGWVFRWDQGAEVIWWNDPNKPEWTEDDKRRWREQRKKADEDKEQLHARTARLTLQLLQACTESEHNYLHIKGLGELKGFVLKKPVPGHPEWVEGALIVPMRDCRSNALVGAQQIYWDEPERKYQKKMLRGTRAKGAVLWLGAKVANEAILCEGYATGLSIFKACRSVGLQAAVVVCFSAGNLEHVAPLIKLPRRFVFADNDASGVGEATAVKTGLPYTMSPEPGYDANDHHRKLGLMQLTHLIMEMRNKC